MGKARNALIRLALEEWLEAGRSSEAMLAFKGVRGAPRFEKICKGLKPPRKLFDTFCG
jgi:hypothetical protein